MGSGTKQIKGYDHTIICTSEIANSGKITHESGSSHLHFVIEDQDTINDTISEMISGIDNQLANEESITDADYEKIGKLGVNNTVLDFTSEPDGTYYINVDKYSNLKN